MAGPDEGYCCWELLFRSRRADVRLFVCLRAWRYAILQRKHRLQTPSPREWEQARFFERELPLHAVVTALDHGDDTLSESFELLGAVYALFPGSTELLDHQRRPALFYALHQRWGMETLSWLVDKSLGVVMEKDSSGVALVTHAILNKCPEELVVRLAVAVTLRCLCAVSELLDGQHHESARRFCQRALVDFFAGVPKFPHARCRDALLGRHNAEDSYGNAAATAVKAIWEQFADKWGHFDIPLIQRDLPPVLSPVIDSFVEVAVVAKGEPLTYQWFATEATQDDDGGVQGWPIEGATQPFLFLSQSIQPYNEGTYYCEVANRRGRVISTRMRVHVVDDRIPPDPTRKFLLDRALLSPEETCTIRNLKASAGGFVRHTRTGTTVVFSPDFFICLDADGADVSDSHGAEIVITRSASLESTLMLRPDDTLVSCVTALQPTTMGDLLYRSVLWLPHCLASAANSNAVVIEIDEKTGRVLRDVGSGHASTEGVGDDQVQGFARVAVDHLGAFAVVSRRLAITSGGSKAEAPLVCARLFLLRPKELSTRHSTPTIELSLVLERDLPHCWIQAKELLSREHDFQEGVGVSAWTIDSFSLQVQTGNSVNVLIGDKARVVFRWPPPPLEAVTHVLVTTTDLMGSSAISLTGEEEAPPAFGELAVRVAVRKPPMQTQGRGQKPSEPNSQPGTGSNSTMTLFERRWVVLLPVLRDAALAFEFPPRMPAVLRRTTTRLVLDLAPASNKVLSLGGLNLNEDDNEGSELRGKGADDLDLNEEVAIKAEEVREREREFTPYFYVVELAVFSPTFWRRYDRTWWFDKTKTGIIDGMYKVVHRGFEQSATIATSAYAGCVRVAKCSVDRFGAYSEPLLLEPLSETATRMHNALAGFEETPRIVSRSIQISMSYRRLQQLLDTKQTSNKTRRLLYALPRDLDESEAVATVLEEDKTTFRAANHEVTLLLAGFAALERQIKCIKLASDAYAAMLRRFLNVRRAVPELDCYANAMFPVTLRLHELLQEVFEAVTKLSNPGWMQYLLLDEWFESALHKIFHATADVLETSGRGVRCTPALCRDLRAGLEEGRLDRTISARDSSVSRIMRAARKYLLLAAGRLQETPGQATKLFICRELCHSLQLCREHDEQQQEDAEAMASEVLAEFESPATQTALETLRQNDTFRKHLVGVTPSDGEKCARVPEAVHLDLDPFVRGVNSTGMHLVLRVTNLSLNNCTVQGKTTFYAHTGRLAFIPAAEFERKSHFRVAVRPQELLSSLGGTLPESSAVSFHFSTPS